MALLSAALFESESHREICRRFRIANRGTRIGFVLALNHLSGDQFGPAITVHVQIFAAQRPGAGCAARDGLAAEDTDDWFRNFFLMALIRESLKSSLHGGARSARRAFVTFGTSYLRRI